MRPGESDTFSELFAPGVIGRMLKHTGRLHRRKKRRRHGFIPAASWVPDLGPRAGVEERMRLSVCVWLSAAAGLRAGVVYVVCRLSGGVLGGSWWIEMDEFFCSVIFNH